MLLFFLFFFFNDTATTEIYTLSLHDALPIWCGLAQVMIKEIAVPVLVHPQRVEQAEAIALDVPFGVIRHGWFREVGQELLRSEEHTSELQSRSDLVCRLLLEKKKKTDNDHYRTTKKTTINSERSKRIARHAITITRVNALCKAITSKRTPSTTKVEVKQ